MRESGTNMLDWAAMIIEQNKFQDLLNLIEKLNFEVEEIKNQNIKISMKNDQTPVTQADLFVNDQLNKFIKTTNYKNVISEENKKADYEDRSSWDWFWIIDPIDGTKEFIKKGNDYTINIALCYKNRPVLSVVSKPSSGDIYYACKNGGAYKNGHSISSNNVENNIKLIASKSHLNKETERFISELSKSLDFETISIGSSLKICVLAEGKAQIYPRFGTTMEWDTAAADLILTESGGKLLNCSNLKPLIYNKEDLRNDYFICFSESLSDEQKKTIKSLVNTNA